MRQVVAARRVRVNAELCLDPARRLKEGDILELLGRSERLPEAFTEDLVVRHLDGHVAVVEKPSGINTVRHPDELTWKAVRRGLSPTLEDRLHAAIAARLRQPARRIDAPAKGSPTGQTDKRPRRLCSVASWRRSLGEQFRAHTVDRQYLAVVPGHPSPGTVRTWLVRDRGDGRRGSTRNEGNGKHAITHLVAVEPIGAYSIVTCRLETGRTHQIRIHLSELGHPVCGDPVYHLRPDGTRIPDDSGAPRLALHAAVLGFDHPTTGKRLRWEMPPPADMRQFIERISKHGN